MSKNLVTIQKIAKVLGIICKVLYVMAIVGMILSIAALVSMIVFSNNPEFAEKIASSGKYNIKQIIGLCVVAVIVCLVHLIVVKAHRNYFIMEQEVGTPFTQEGAKAFRTLGIMNIVAPFISIIVSAIAASVCNIQDKIHMEAGIGMGVAMILLSYVLAYGAELEEKKKVEKK